MAAENAIEAAFARKDPQLLELFHQLMAELNTFGSISISIKSSVIYLKKKHNFASVQPRKSHLNLEFLTGYPIENPRIMRRLQLSARRYAHTVQIAQASDLDPQLLEWLKDAYTLIE